MTCDLDSPHAAPVAASGPGGSSTRLVATLAVAGALAGLLLVFADLATRDAIAEHARRALQEAIQEVLGEPARVISLRVEGDGLVADETPTFSVDADAVDRPPAARERSAKSPSKASRGPAPSSSDAARRTSNSSAT